MDWSYETRYKITRTTYNGTVEHGYLNAYQLMMLVFHTNNAIPCEESPEQILQLDVFVFSSPAESILLGMPDETFRTIQRRPPTQDDIHFDKVMAAHRAEMWKIDCRIDLTIDDVIMFRKEHEKCTREHKIRSEQMMKDLLGDNYEIFRTSTTAQP